MTAAHQSARSRRFLGLPEATAQESAHALPLLPRASLHTRRVTTRAMAPAPLLSNPRMPSPICGTAVSVSHKLTSGSTDTLKDEQQRLEYQRNIDKLSARLEASEKKKDEYRAKYKHGLNEMAEKKTVKAKSRESDAEQQIKQLKQKHKEDIIAIRKELINAAKEAVGPIATASSSPEHLFGNAETALKKLKSYDPEQYYDLVKAQSIYSQLAAKLEATKAAQMLARSSPRPDAATTACAQALSDLELDLVNAADDMRTNSTLTNQKKTLVSQTSHLYFVDRQRGCLLTLFLSAQTKKMLAALKEFEPVLMAHAQSIKAEPEATKPLTPTADNSLILRKNQQLQGMVKDLQYKLRDVRGKLEEEVEMRQKAEAEAEEVERAESARMEK